MVVAFQASVNCNRIPLGSVGWEFSFNGWVSKTNFEPITHDFQSVILNNGNPIAPQELDQHI